MIPTMTQRTGAPEDVAPSPGAFTGHNVANGLGIPKAKVS